MLLNAILAESQADKQQDKMIVRTKKQKKKFELFVSQLTRDKEQLGPEMSVVSQSKLVHQEVLGEVSGRVSGQVTGPDSSGREVGVWDRIFLSSFSAKDKSASDHLAKSLTQPLCLSSCCQLRRRGGCVLLIKIFLYLFYKCTSLYFSQDTSPLSQPVLGTLDLLNVRSVPVSLRPLHFRKYFLSSCFKA